MQRGDYINDIVIRETNYVSGYHANTGGLKDFMHPFLAAGLSSSGQCVVRHSLYLFFL